MSLLIYCATGYTGTLMSDQARARSLDFLVAGRDPVKVGHWPSGWASRDAVFPSMTPRPCARTSKPALVEFMGAVELLCGS